MAATACVYLENPTRPEVCASDIDTMGPKGDWSVLGVVALLLALIGAGGAAYLLLRTRRTVTDLSRAVGPGAGARLIPRNARASAVVIGGRWASRAASAARATSSSLPRTGRPLA